MFQTSFALEATTVVAIIFLVLCPADGFGQQADDQQADDQQTGNTELTPKEAIAKAAQALRNEIGVGQNFEVNRVIKAQQQAAMAAAIRDAQQRKLESRLMLRVDATLQFRVLNSQAPGDSENARANTSEELKQHIRGTRRFRVERDIKTLEPYCDLNEEQRKKLFLAAEADTKSIEREALRWFEKYGNADTTAQLLRASVIDLRHLNELAARKYSEEESLVPKVFSAILTEDQRQQLRASYVIWFSDYAFAVGIPKDLRPRLMELVNKRAQEVPLGFSQKEFCARVIEATPREEFVSVVGEDYTVVFEKLKNRR